MTRSSLKLRPVPAFWNLTPSVNELVEGEVLKQMFKAHDQIVDQFTNSEKESLNLAAVAETYGVPGFGFNPICFVSSRILWHREEIIHRYLRSLADHIEDSHPQQLRFHSVEMNKTFRRVKISSRESSRNKALVVRNKITLVLENDDKFN